MQLPISPRRLGRALALVFAICLALPLAALRAAEAPAQPLTIRVGLAWGKGALTVSAPGGLSVRDLQSGQTVIQYASSVDLSAGSGGIVIKGYGQVAGPLEIAAAGAQPGAPNDPTGDQVSPQIGGAVPDNFLTYGGARYRGSFRVLRDGNGQLTLVNILPLEEYLLGVVPREMPADWPLEALKAQAVAARTYATYHVLTGGYGDYDVRNTTDSQVYGGYSAEDPRASAAVQATAGEVAVYGGALINAYFFSSSGGYTEANENVWSGSALPYLRPVPDYDQDSPWFSWHLDLPMSQVEQALTAAGYGVGKLYEVIPDGQTQSGRWARIIIRGSTGSRTLTGNQFRLAIGATVLRSTKFTVRPLDARLADVQQAYQGSETLPVVAAGGRVASAPLSGASVVAAGGTTALAGYTVVGKQAVPASLSFDGGGYGHGVGLSQWGARGMALQGYNYQDILKHYYTGIEIVNQASAAAAAQQ